MGKPLEEHKDDGEADQKRPPRRLSACRLPTSVHDGLAHAILLPTSLTSPRHHRRDGSLSVLRSCINVSGHPTWSIFHPLRPHGQQSRHATPSIHVAAALEEEVDSRDDIS